MVEPDEDAGRGESSEDSEELNPTQQRWMPKDCRVITGCRDPFTWEPTLELFIRDRLTKLTAQKGIGHTRQLAYTVPEIVRNPSGGIYRGCTDRDGEDGEEDWFIFAGIPSRAYDLRTGEARRPYQKETFLVFVDGERIIRRWGWTDADSSNWRRPLDHDNERFRETLL